VPEGADMTAAPLAMIVALARAGALDRAWQLFTAGGYAGREDDPAALTVLGRLLKDRAALAGGGERRRLLSDAAEAYRRSAALRPGTYPLINAATLSLLAGDAAAAAELAGDVLDRIAQAPDEPETPYWKGATIAEALLLTGRGEEAADALKEALAAAPRAWEDHGSTLRQFLLIHEALGLDATWLDMLRPPRSLSWSGRPAAPDAAAEEALRDRVGSVIARERVGFAYGGGAPGAELIAAETALQAGAKVHLILPCPAAAYAAAFVQPHGTVWQSRFDAVLEAAESVYAMRGEATPEMLVFAARLATGAARLNADRLMSGALHIELGEGESGATGGSPAPLALLCIDAGPAEEASFQHRLDLLHGLLGGFGALPVGPYLRGGDVIAGFVSAAQAARAAETVQAQLPVRIGAHCGLFPLVRDPFAGAARPAEGSLTLLNAVAQATPPDTVCASFDFAAALAATGQDRGRARWIGELTAFDGGSDIPLYALVAPRSDDQLLEPVGRDDD